VVVVGAQGAVASARGDQEARTLSLTLALTLTLTLTLTPNPDPDPSPRLSPNPNSSSIPDQAAKKLIDDGRLPNIHCLLVGEVTFLNIQP